MTRPLRVGDRVTATGTVARADGPAVGVRFERADGTKQATSMWADALTLIAPAEPPVGSVVVKDNKAFVKSRNAWYAAASGAPVYRWDEISDGDVIFTPAGDADVG